VIDYGGRQGSETLIRNAVFPEGSKPQATLSMQSAGQNLSLPAEVVTYDAELQTVRLLFPSLAALGLSDAAMEVGNLRLSLRLGEDEPRFFEALYIAPPAPPPVQIVPGLAPGAPTPGGPTPGGPTPGGPNLPSGLVPVPPR